MQQALQDLLKRLPDNFTRAAFCWHCGEAYAFDKRQKKVYPHCGTEDETYIPVEERKP